MIGSASFDRTRRYRYTLTRCWDSSAGRVAFVMLNPSRADASEDDPTIRRCVRFARDWGFGSLEVVNLFAWRARRPVELRGVSDPVGPRCDLSIRRAASRSQALVAAWGVHGTFLGRDRLLADLDRRHGLLLGRGDPVWCLGTTRAGQPRHPLYVPASRRRVPWATDPARAP